MKGELWELDNLKGKVIDSILISQCNFYVKIVYGDEYMILEGAKDCHICTYWYSIEGKDALKDAPVISVELTDTVELCSAKCKIKYERHHHYTCEEYQAIVITTHKGRCKLEMRVENEENYGLAYKVFVNKEPHCSWAPHTPIMKEDSFPWKEWKEDEGK